jgi:hypothetical protein
VNEVGTPTRDAVPVAVRIGAGLTLRTWTTDAGTKTWITAACTHCKRLLWDDELTSRALGMLVQFATVEQARQELPDWGWAMTTQPDGTERVLCHRCTP